MRDKLIELLGNDRWVSGRYPAVQPETTAELRVLLEKYPGSVVIVGSGSSFANDFNPGVETLIILTRRLLEVFNLSDCDQVLEVSCGFPVGNVNQQLMEQGFIVPSLARFSKGSVGGRLASVTSRPREGVANGWISSLLGLDVITPDGEVFNLGGRCIKDVAGYDLRHIFTGSKGALGVITRGVFRCFPLSVVDEAALESKPTIAGRCDLKWKRLLDPKGRMHTGA